MNLKQQLQTCFLTFFYSGKVKFAPGTFGSLAGLLAGFCILYYLEIQTLFLASILLFIAAIGVINDYEARSKTHDDKSIVIDEVAGIWLALSLGAWACNSWLNLALCFVLFRLFDILKPSIIGRVDKSVKGGLGVMLDDMLAGLFAGLLASIIHGVILKFDFHQTLLPHFSSI